MDNDVQNPEPRTTESDTPSVKLSRAQIEKIVDDNGEIYRNDIHKSTWKVRTQGMWAGGGLGIIFGGIIGALTALSPIIIGLAAPAALFPLFWPVTGAFAVAGMLTGVATVTSVDASAGAIVGGLKVDDRRKLLNDPEEGLEETLKYRGVNKEKPSFWRSFLLTKDSQKIFSVRNALIVGAFGLGFGALLVASGGLGILGPLTGMIAAHLGGAAAAAPIINCMTYAACGLFGALFGIDGPTITANAVEFVGNIFGGKVLKFGHGLGDPAARAQAREIESAIPRSKQSQPVIFQSADTPQQGATLSPGRNMLLAMAQKQMQEMNPDQAMKH